MDPINIIVGLNIIATFGANVSGAKKGFKDKIGAAKEKPNTYLQKLPLILSTITLLGLILGVFQIGTLEYVSEYNLIRYIGLAVYLIFSWVQIWAFKTLGENYSQDILIKKDHQLVTKGPFRIIRHPQYMSQMLLDLGGAAAVLSFIVAPIAVIQILFILLRASVEDKLMEKHFGNEFSSYKKKSGFVLPFIG
ncbi:MAG: isoprenylcysteine carboxylmethyltransferase family protein [Ignavibacteria bacterium]|jgi:protein-S-isoprenylcysteine O-methyltransferase Ste14|nr:MAG: isoprenylcysteine carboxylmethyltransferase family protein [Ignavibacteria bacterium]